MHNEEKVLVQSWTEAHLVPLSQSVRNYEQKKELCWLAVRDIKPSFSRKWRRSPPIWPPCGDELWLETRDGVCVGRVDRINNKGGVIEVIDYKSKVLLPHAEMGDDLGTYTPQLKYYAALYHAQYREWPTILKIVANGGQEIEIPFTHDECESLLKEAYTLLAKVNCTIRSASLDKRKALSSLAKPSPKTCSLCLFRPVCAPYWEGRSRAPNEDWPNDLHGTIIETGRWGKDRVYLDIAPYEGDKYVKVKVIEVSSGRHPALKREKKEVYLFSLLQYKDRPDVFAEGKYTTIYVPKH
ncbi:hypothetical protein J2129_001575 [Methanofollis sp. W23]|nr:hypothetical protein [Methanofollis sp. W23]